MTGRDLATNLEFHYGLVNWFIGQNINARPTTRFIVPYLTAVGELKDNTQVAARAGGNESGGTTTIDDLGLTLSAVTQGMREHYKLSEVVPTFSSGPRYPPPNGCQAGIQSAGDTHASATSTRCRS